MRVILVFSDFFCDVHCVRVCVLFDRCAPLTAVQHGVSYPFIEATVFE